MSNIALTVEGLGKKYRIGERREAYKTFRDGIASAARGSLHKVSALFSRNGRARSSIRRDYWALRDVSFQVKHGEVVGIIGKNGAGKSTLLKILSRITDPSEGRARLFGRVGSLLEAGTGFHPELTGRENVYLNGAILGMSKAEINRKFEEIIAFAEVEKFLDTPVKRYSSGMQLRLGFAVAAHLEPDILIVDEVLAVGDTAFQQKCLGKMQSAASLGRTVLLVSHQMNQIRRLCGKVVWLENGSVRDEGSAEQMISAYEDLYRTERAKSPGAALIASRGTHFLSWELLDSKSDKHTLETFEKVTFRFCLRVDEDIEDWVHGIALQNPLGGILWSAASSGRHLPAGIYHLDYELPCLPLRPGHYDWHASIWGQGAAIDIWAAVPPLHVATKPVTHRSDDWVGILNIPYTITILPKHPTHTPGGIGYSSADSLLIDYPGEDR